jgi:hypothetical protein
MTADEKLIAMLRSAKASDRYDACELLRVAPEIAPETVLALENVLRDPDPEVAERAASALRVHSSAARQPPAPVGEQGPTSGPPSPLSLRPALAFGAAAALLAFCLLLLSYIVPGSRDAPNLAGLLALAFTLPFGLVGLSIAGFFGLDLEGPLLSAVTFGVTLVGWFALGFCARLVLRRLLYAVLAMAALYAVSLAAVKWLVGVLAYR